MSLYLTLSKTDSVLSLVVLLVGLLSVLAVAGLDRGRRGPGARGVLARLLVGGYVLCALAKTVVALVMLATSGGVIAADKVLVDAPVVLLPAVALVTMTWPALGRIASATRADGEADASLRARAAAPKLVAPVYVAAVAAGADVRFDYFAAAQAPYVDDLLFVAGMCVVAAAVSTLVQRWIVARRLGARSTSAPRAVRFAAVVVLGLVPVIAGIVYSVRSSELPGSYAMVDDNADMGGMPMSQMTSVADLTGPKDGTPDARFTLTASTKQLTIDGHVESALTFNGTAPGPLLRVKEGQLVEVTLVNDDVADGVTLHWHGLEVPNAEDGVAGVTQDAVRPGQRMVYRFRPHQVGTFWYHSHQDSDTEVGEGLYGAFIVDPATPAPAAPLDLTAIAHVWTDVTTMGSSTVDKEVVRPGQQVRVRLVNTDSWPMRFAVSGASFRVVGIDGNAVHDPGVVSGDGLLIGGGGRNDILLTMPDGPVTIHAFVDARQRRTVKFGIEDPSMVLSADGHADPADVTEPTHDVDLASYGTPAPTPFNADSHFAEQQTYYLDQMLIGFYNGKLKTTYSLNGELFPDTPMLMVHEGDLVEITFVNRSPDDHPMHLHGHTLLVLTRDGKATTGSPWWTDTLNVAPGESYTVGFRADNPGVWMDHCHNLLHAAGGMTMHLAYYGVTDPFRAGTATGNNPE